jgi:hypothetical protein
MFVYSLSNPIVTECTFIENTSEIGGGMHSSSYTEPTVTDCTFVRNTSIIGGGMYNRENEPSVARCTFIGNRAQNGGGMYNWDVRLFTPLFRTAVSHCVFVGNVADSGDGGAMFNRNSLFSVTNCAFVGNMAIETDDPFSTGSGGGIFNFDTFNRIHNCTFFGNVAERDGGGFGSVLFAVAEVRNTILWSNIADANGDTGGPFHGEAAQITGSLGAQLFNSCIKDDDPDDSSVPFGGAANGNIDDDPFLRRLPNPGPDGVFGTDDDDLGDLRLRPGSPCINRGDNALLPPDVLDLDGDGDFDEPIPFDLGGLPRVFLEIVDMGAYEFTIEIPEVCHVESGHENDCNDNGVEDHCEFEIGFGRDCNRNGVLDACELADGRLVDGDGNGTPDACEPPRGEIGEGLAAMNDSAAFITPMSADRACSEFPVEMSTAVELIGYDISSAGAEAPTTVSLVPQGPAGQYLVELDRPIPQRQWTSITLTVRNNMGVVDVCLHVAHLPCDSNLDGEVGLADVSAFVGQVRDGAHLMLADINGDGDTGLSDTSAWVNNFNGNAAIGIPRANGTSLPAKPNCP